MTNLEIEAFLAVVRLGSITAAAQAIFITQPALSRRLQTLEEELGYPLFRRGKGQRNIQLTEEGKAFVPVAERWRQLWRQSREIAGLSHRGKMTVAVIGSINTYLMPPGVSLFSSPFSGQQPCCHRPALCSRLRSSGERAGGSGPHFGRPLCQTGGYSAAVQGENGAGIGRGCGFSGKPATGPAGSVPGTAAALEPGIQPLARLLVWRGTTACILRPDGAVGRFYPG